MSDDTPSISPPSLPPDFDALWDHADPAATEQRFRALLPAIVAGGDAWVDAHTRLLTQIARTEGLQQRFEAAHGTLDEAERLLPPGGRTRRNRTLPQLTRCWRRTHGSPNANRCGSRGWPSSLRRRVANDASGAPTSCCSRA